MAQQGPAALAESILRSATERHVAAGEDPVSGEHPLVAAAANAGLGSEVGTVRFAGRQHSSSDPNGGPAWVSFRRPNGGSFTSSWPVWAYEIARTALATNKRLWIIFDGDPEGDKLLFAFLYA